ncbi:Uncharacterized protein FKW44_008579 [Caligus rogercresseyi]|uniref:Uncharacterized protein n=1 Tax=Caligus rogercresseyi TaxID=217165 RepID=A0A7T8QUD1_CALRO|nr:Uncharacterized protein FKW44_008579 [Caligus rogercresseyi]
MFCFLNVGGLDDRSSSSLRIIIMFGLSSRGMKISDKTKALDFALLNTKALREAYKYEPIRPGEIRGILLGAAGRYAVFSLKIPLLDGSSWTFAAELIKHYPTQSHRFYQILRKIIKNFKKFA